MCDPAWVEQYLKPRLPLPPAPAANVGGTVHLDPGVGRAARRLSNSFFDPFKKYVFLDYSSMI